MDENRCRRCGDNLIEVGHDSPGESEGLMCTRCAVIDIEDRRKTVIGVLALCLGKPVRIHEGPEGETQHTLDGKLVVGHREKPYTVIPNDPHFTDYSHFHFDEVEDIAICCLFGEGGDPSHLGVTRNIFLRE